MSESFTFSILDLENIRNVENAIIEKLMKREPTISDWNNLYRERWLGLITPESIAHPAKFSRALIRRIYSHAIGENWLQAGSQVLDCFGGVALGAFDAMRHGLCWTGVELEPRFIEMGNANIALWNERYKGRLAAWGTAQLLGGDSRKLAELINSRMEAMISSPPYANALSSTENGIDWAKVRGDFKGRRNHVERIAYNKKRHSELNYGADTDNLGNLREGDFSAVISSPPFVESLASDDPLKRKGLFADPKRANDKTLTATYGESEGQLGAMKAGALITSSPFEKGSEGVMRASKFKDPVAFALEQKDKGHGCSFEAKMNAMQKDEERAEYGTSAGNIGNQSGETFWAASKIILEQCHQVLGPNAKAIFVCKDFVRNKKIVPFCEQWAALCEAVGFRLLHIHRGWLVEHKDGQHRLDGGCDELSIERKSFFRRLAEKKGSPRIDFEVVMCFERI